MLAAMLVMPGAIPALILIALLVVLARTRAGRRLIVVARRRVPPRVRVRVKRVLALAAGEKSFLPTHPRVHSA